MATATGKSPNYYTPAQVAAFNANVVKAGRRAGNLYLDGCDRLVENVISVQQKLADRSKIEAVKTLTATEVDVTRQLTSSYTAAARALIS
jgi:hypothetical protein